MLERPAKKEMLKRVSQEGSAEKDQPRRKCWKGPAKMSKSPESNAARKRAANKASKSPKSSAVRKRAANK